MPWLLMSMGIFSVTIIANAVVSPIRMVSFIAMETLQPVSISDQPDITGSQIEILAINDTDVFDTIPDVSFRNHYRSLYHQCRCHIHRLRSHYHWGNHKGRWHEC